MATQKKNQQVAGRSFAFGSGPVSNPGNLGTDVPHLPESGYVVVAVLLMIFICLVVPLMAMLYFDTLTLQKKVERTEARIEKLVKILEERKDASPDRPK